MLRRILTKGLVITGLVAGAGAFAGSAQAATCGITGSATATAATYDPFSPTGLPTTIVTLNLVRLNPQGGEKTDIVNFYLKSTSSAADGTILKATSVVMAGDAEGLNQNIFYNYAATPPTVAPTSLNPVSPNNFLKLSFTGNNDASDTAVVTFTVSLPANLNLNASTVLPFDANFACSTTGGGKGTQQTGTIANAIQFPITVQSALRASFAGGLVGATPALAFGEIGNELAGGKLTPVNNYIRVQATAPYKVNLSSERDFRMTPGGLATANANERIGYNLKFLGEIKTAGTVGGIVNMQCKRPGVGDNLEDKLYIQAQLAEAGAGKAPSTNYFDTLTVTIEPLAIGAADSAFVCGGAGNGQF